MAERQQDVEKYFSELEKLEQQKQGIIEKLLQERAAIDEQLAKLGYTGGRKGRPQGSRDSRKRQAKKGSTAAK
jgi:hypothetical protein